MVTGQTSFMRCRLCARLPLEVHEAVFAWVLERLAEHGLIKGDRIGVDASIPPRPPGRVSFGDRIDDLLVINGGQRRPARDRAA